MYKFFYFQVFILLISVSGLSQNSELTNRVLVIKNLNSPISIAVADDYMARRNVTKVVNLNCNDNGTNSNNDYLEYSQYVTTVENPIKDYLLLHPEIDFIVFTKGIPNHIYNTPNKPYNGVCCLDSRISALGYENSSTSSIVSISDVEYGNAFVGQAWANNFWNSSVPFSHSEFGGYLVTRLDGYTQNDAIALTSRSLLAESNLANETTNSGTILLDACANFGFPNEPQPYSIYPVGYVPGNQINITTEGAYGLYNSDMQEASDVLVAKNISVEYENTNTFVGNLSDLNGYVSWGSNDTNYIAANYNSLSFSAGALGETAVSTGGRTFLPTTGGQSLIADLVSQGITGVKGYTDEPLLLAVASPKILFDRYTNGWTLAESFYAASRLIGWMDIVIGDPICRAYAQNPLNNYSANANRKSVVNPNPSSEFIFITNIENSPITIHEVSGKKIMEFLNYTKNQKINISILENGIYFIRTNTGNLKFVKNK